MTLGEKIYFYRKQCALNQEELAERVGVSRQAVSKWELGDSLPEVDKLLTLARIFGVTTDELLTPDPPEERSSFTQTSQQSTPPQPRSTVDFSGLSLFFRRWGFLVGIPFSAYGVVLLYWGFIVAATGGHISKVGPANSAAGLLQTVGITMMLAGFTLLIGGAALAKHLWGKRKAAVSTEKQTEKNSPED